MSQLHLNQIRARILERFRPLESHLRIEASKDQDKFLSRALSALAIQRFADINEEDAALSVVDHEDDGGIDAIYFSQHNLTLYIVQSKWKNDTLGGIALGDTLKYCDGIRQLLQSNATYFGGPIANRWSSIEDALNKLLNVVVIFTYSSETKLDEKQDNSLRDVIIEFNQPTEIARVEIFSQLEIHSFLASGVDGDDINETLRLFQWGVVEQPHLAYYGQMAAEDLVNLSKKYNQRLFSSNIRQFLGKSGPANADIIHTAQQNPELFWYYNNGVTIISKKMRKTAVGGAKRDVGDIECEGLSIVNGAQTVGALTQIPPGSEPQLQLIYLPVRIISLDNGGDKLGLDITRATNTQNRVDSRNFVALSPLHQRIRRDLLMDGVTYVIQQTDSEELGPKLFGVSEAFAAMACALSDPDAAVLAKREIGRLWENLDSPLHSQMFPDNISGSVVWRNISISRIVEQELNSTRLTMDSSREKTVLYHGNRLATHIVFRALEKYGYDDEKKISDISSSTAIFLSIIVAKSYNNQYPAVIFKNLETSKNIADEIYVMLLGHYSGMPGY